MPPLKVQRGSLLTSNNWNDLVDDLNKKIDNTGGNITGQLSVSQRVGIRTTTPQTELDVRGKARFSSLSFSDQNGTPYHSNWIGMAENIEGRTKWLHIGGITDGGVRRIALFANRTYVYGDLGLGTTQPQSRLHVDGDITTKWGFSFSHYEKQWGSHSKRPWLHKSWNGHIGDYLYIGSTGNRSNKVQGALVLSEKGAFFGNGHDGGKEITKKWMHVTDKGDLHVTGNAFKPGGGSWRTASDRRLKIEEGNFIDGLSLLQKVKPVKYRYNGAMDFPSDKEYVGVHAQDIKALFPYMVGTFKGKLGEKETDLLDLDENAFTYILINAVKELAAKVERLEQSNI